MHPTVDGHSGYFQVGISKNKCCFGLLHDSRKLETVQMSMNKRMDNQIVVYSYDEIAPRNKKTKPLIYAIAWISLKSLMLIEIS